MRGRKPQGSKSKTPVVRPVCPKHLDDRAKKAWNSVCDDLAEQGSLVKTDRKLIELYACTYSFWQKAGEELENVPLTTIVMGRPFLTPLANLYNSLSTKLQRQLLALGLSPTSRKSAGGSLPDNPFLDICGDI